MEEQIQEEESKYLDEEQETEQQQLTHSSHVDLEVTATASEILRNKYNGTGESLVAVEPEIVSSGGIAGRKEGVESRSAGRIQTNVMS